MLVFQVISGPYPKRVLPRSQLLELKVVVYQVLETVLVEVYLQVPQAPTRSCVCSSGTSVCFFAICKGLIDDRLLLLLEEKRSNCNGGCRNLVM